MEFIFILLLIVIHGYLVLGEFAMISVKRSRLETALKHGNKKAGIALGLLDDIDNYLSAMQIGITLISIIEGAYGGVAMGHYIEPLLAPLPLVGNYAHQISISIVVALITYLSLIIGELAPKYIGIQHAERFAIAFAPSMRFITWFTGPISRFLSWSTKTFMRMLFLRPSEANAVSEEEIKLLIAQAKQQGVLEQKESEFIQNILRFADRDAITIMTHRNDLVWIDVQDPTEETDKTVRKSGFTKFLVCDGNIENVLGVLRQRDYIEQYGRKGFDIRRVLTRPLFIPESMNALRILELFRKERNYFGIVVDEYGSVQGIITLHDLTENIFGVLPDIDDNEEPSIITREDGSLLVDGIIPLDELRDVINIPEFSDEDNDFYTLAGYIMYKLNEIPKSGDYFETDGYRFEIVDMDKSKIDKVLIRPIAIEA
ncbi:MAG: hemolysin family protein [Saprospiraceae bacterium]